MSLSADAKRACCEILMLDEGFQQFPYDDETQKIVHAPEGKLTIGFGFNLSAQGLSVKESILVLNSRVDDLDLDLYTVIEEYEHLNDARQIALINMAYNLGVVGLLKFKEMLSAIAVKDYFAASKACMDSLVAANEPDRYKRISEMLLTGVIAHVVSPYPNYS